MEPLPHQITAVYEAMLPRQPLRFLLADDPGAGKTIMAGLLIKELIARGDLKRCLIVCPGSLVEQWQDELSRKFQLPFDIVTNDKLEAARTGNWFLENDLAIARLDKLARDEEVQAKLSAPECRWDLVVCDEAHKMSATFFGGEVRYTKRHRLGQLLSGLTRHFLLMTATPHNGKETDFQLFLALLDGDRFEGRFRDGVHQVDVSDLMRRMIKEKLLKFDGRPLFPERIAYTVPYKLTDPEARLYTAVTAVRPRGVQSRRKAPERQARRYRRLRPHHPAAPLGVLARGHLRVPASPPRTPRKPSARSQAHAARRGASLSRACPCSMPTTSRTSTTPPRTKSKPSASRSSTRPPPPAPSPSFRPKSPSSSAFRSLAAEVRRTGDTKWRELARVLETVLTPTGIAHGARRA